jgi:hypothetical protein
MRVQKTALGALAIVGALAVLMAGALQTAADPGGGATVIQDFGCQIIPPDWGGPITLYTTDTQAVITPSGNTKLTCHFDIPSGLEPKKANVEKDFRCGTFLGTTTDSQAVATPGGNVKLTCVINGS